MARPCQSRIGVPKEPFETGVDRIGSSARRRLTGLQRRRRYGMYSETTVKLRIFQGCFRQMGLAANAEPLQNSLVALRIRVAQVRQKSATLGDQGQQSLAGTVVFFVRLEVLREYGNPPAHQSNLYF